MPNDSGQSFPSKLEDAFNVTIFTLLLCYSNWTLSECLASLHSDPQGEMTCQVRLIYTKYAHSPTSLKAEPSRAKPHEQSSGTCLQLLACEHLKIVRTTG